MKTVYLVLSIFLLSCASKPSKQTIDGAYTQYGTKAVYDKPFTKEQLANQKKYQEQQDKVALEQEELRKKEQARLEEEKRVQELENQRLLREAQAKKHSEKVKPVLKTNNTFEEENKPLMEQIPEVVPTPVVQPFDPSIKEPTPKLVPNNPEDILDFKEGL